MLRFTIRAIPIEVRPTFWLMGLLLGLPLMLRGRQPSWMLPTWLLILFLSVLGHELGHAFSARRLGAEASVRLHGMGGVTSWSMDEPVPPAKRIAIALSGSAVGLAMGGLAWVVVRFVSSPESVNVATAISLFVTTNVFWGILNWLPIRPLDGGHILAGLLEAFFGARAEVLADIAFPVVTIAIGSWAWNRGYPVGALLAAFALLSEVQFRRNRRDGNLGASAAPRDTR